MDIVQSTSPDPHFKMIGRTLQNLLDLKYTIEEVTQSQRYRERYSIKFRRHYCFDPEWAAHNIEEMGMKVTCINLCNRHVDIDITAGHREEFNIWTAVRYKFVSQLSPVKIWDPTVHCGALDRQRG